MWHKENSEKIREDYISKNTFLLTPSLLREYLAQVGLIEKKAFKEESSSIRNDLEQFLDFLGQNPPKNDFLKTFAENQIFIDLFVTIALESYEVLCRILMLLDRHHEENKIKDNELKELITKVKQDRCKFLPKTSIDLKKKLNEKKSVKNLLVFLLYKMFSEDFGKYYNANISNGELYELIGKSITRFCENIITLKMLPELIRNHPGVKSQVLDLLQLIYSSKSKGMLKAKEGIKYEEVLKEVLDFHGIPHELEEKNEEDENEETSEQTRKWDIYIPNKSNPKIVIEVMYVITTSSGMTNKRKVIVAESEKGLMKIFALMDGAGWIARWSDAKKILEADVYTFTFHKESLEKAINTIKNQLNNSAT
ncbi:MAG: hypothetical protein QXU45_09810 [Candidatus Bathyarchaeia archaeon]